MHIMHLSLSLFVSLSLCAPKPLKISSEAERKKAWLSPRIPSLQRLPGLAVLWSAHGVRLPAIDWFVSYRVFTWKRWLQMTPPPTVDRNMCSVWGGEKVGKGRKGGSGRSGGRRRRGIMCVFVVERQSFGYLHQPPQTWWARGARMWCKEERC